MAREREHLMAAVAAHPDDDLPRLVFADWLDEQGGDADAARAAFIRAQIAEWRDPTPWEVTGTERPSESLAAAWRDVWLAALPEKQRGWVAFERGFAETLRPSGTRTGFLSLLEKPAGELSTVDRLDVPYLKGLRDADLGRVAASRGVGRVRELGWGSYSTGPMLRELLTGPHGGRLESLRCGGYVLRPRELLAAHAPALRRLTLALCYFSADPEDRLRPAHVRGSPLLRGLAELDLRAGGHGPATLEALCQEAALPHVRRLTLEYHAPSLDRVAAAIDLPSLRRLRVDGNHDLPGAKLNAVAAALAGNRRLARLESLSIDDIALPLDAFARLVESDALAGLKRLDATVGGDPDRLHDYLLASDAPLRLDKLCVGGWWPRSGRAAELKGKYRDRLQTHTDHELEPTRRRLGPLP